MNSEQNKYFAVNLPGWAIAAPVAGGAVGRVEKSVSSPRSLKMSTCDRGRHPREYRFSLSAGKPDSEKIPMGPAESDAWWVPGTPLEALPIGKNKISPGTETMSEGGQIVRMT